MDKNLPGIVVTGASGFVGRHFLAAAAGHFRLFCVARRSQREAGVPQHENLRWMQVDIARWDTMREAVQSVKKHGGAEYVLHLAGYYDFQFMEHPEYDRTNVQGTRNVLKLARQLGVSRFIFASSLAACTFPRAGAVVDEDTPADAAFAYARSKRAGEELVTEHSEFFAASIVRMAAVFSDWCEYPPLYIFLRTWLGDEWNRNILGGHGNSAVTYIHIRDLVKMFLRIIEKSDELPRLATYNASPNHTTSHRQLYEAATWDFFGEEIRPRFIPRWLAGPGVLARWWLGRLRGKPPFEAPWMISYLDKELRVDASRTHAALDWRPAPRLDVARRLLVMIENMKSHGEVWRERNEAALRRVAQRPNLRISDLLEELREELIDQIVATVQNPPRTERFAGYRRLAPEVLRWHMQLVYQVVVTAVRTRDRQLVRQYAQVIAARRKKEGFAAGEVQDLLTAIGRLIAGALRARPELADLGLQIHDNITLSFQLACDGVEDAYEQMEPATLEFDGRVPDLDGRGPAADLEHMVHMLQDICDDAFPAALRVPPGAETTPNPGE